MSFWALLTAIVLAGLFAATVGAGVAALARVAATGAGRRPGVRTPGGGHPTD